MKRGGLTPKEDRFCVLHAAGVPMRKAFVDAGYSAKSVGSGIHRILQKPACQERLAFLRKQAGIKFEITAPAIAEKLELAYKHAMLDSQFGAAVSAAMGLAKLGGLLIDKQEVHHTVVRPSREPTKEIELSVEDWTERFKPKALQ